MRFSSKSRAACFCCFFSDLLIWLNLYDDQIACQCWCRQSANTWHTKLKSGASNLHGAGASNLQDNTLILGENGTGKSFLLKSIADIFIFLDKAQIYKRKPKFHYEKFSISYFYKGNEYVIDRKSGSKIICKKNGMSIDLYDVELPTNVLAVSFMVNDKFLFIDPNQKQSNSGMYRYLGVRKTTNATYTSSVISNVVTRHFIVDGKSILFLTV